MDILVQREHTCDRVRSDSIVLGLHWTPNEVLIRQGVAPDLDAICELRDWNGRLLEVVGPARLASVNGSVIHTGDSRTGASYWDDERIFVFIEALPECVCSVVFTVTSSSGEAFCDVPGASCHLSDCATEDRLFSLQLTGLGAVTGHVIARLQRSSGGWLLH